MDFPGMNHPTEPLLVYPHYVLGGEQKLDFILTSEFLDPKYDAHVAFYVNEADGDLPICMADFRKYHSHLFISHAVIDGYFWLLQKKYKDANLHFGSCALWSRYILSTDVTKEQLQKVIKNLISPLDKFLFLPLHIGGNHWCLSRIDFPGKTLEFFDSLDQFQGKKKCKTIQRNLSIAFGYDSTWRIVDHYNDANIQRQNDSHSCAFFTCWYACQLARQGSIGVWMDSWEDRISGISR
jgi:Ulp1 family protease